MKKIIFICKGNMHRSVMAEAFYNLLKKDDSFAESYGTMVDAENGSGVKISSYPEFVPLIDELKNHHGVDISSHARTQVSPLVLQNADKIIVIAEEEFIPDWLRKYPYEKWDIIDDFSTPEIMAEDIHTIKTKVENLLNFH